MIYIHPRSLRHVLRDLHILEPIRVSLENRSRCHSKPSALDPVGVSIQPMTNADVKAKLKPEFV